MNEVVVKEKAPLDELMLAMDVVDTLRHKELMLTREVEADDREQRLLDRLREIYTAQGITVSDDVLKQGVQALQEERFAYKGPVPSFSRSLANLYVTRARWGKWVTMGVAVVALGLGVFEFGVRGPELRAEATLAGELQSAYQTVVGETQDSAALTEAQRLLDDGKAQLGRHELGAAGATVTALHGLDARLRAEATLPGELQSAYQVIVAETQDPTALTEAQHLLDDGKAQVGRREFATVSATLGELRALDTKLREQYDLKIVQRAGERSGVYRVPNDNRRARNYYLIVEAVAPNGQRLTMPIRSEEDGRTQSVREWGLRVDEATFNRVAADKRDDGIIEQDVVGTKHRGVLAPEYSVATTGAAITKW